MKANRGKCVHESKQKCEIRKHFLKCCYIFIILIKNRIKQVSRVAILFYLKMVVPLYQMQLP